MNPKGKGIEYGIDGWRLDVAFNVHHNFWKAWRSWVKSINPDAYLTAEIVDTPDKVKPYLQGDEFDGEMNYNFAFTAAEFLFNPKGMNITASEFGEELRKMRHMYPSGVAYVTQNLFGSHDSNRIGSHILNRGIGNFRDWGKYFSLSQAANNTDYDVSKPGKEEIHLQKLFVLLQMTYVGAPMVYYGDEVGMWGANDPDDRKPMIWSDIKYEDESTLADGTARPADRVAINRELKAHYKTLISIRHQYESLRLGDFKQVLANDELELYAFERSIERDDKQESVQVYLNNSNEKRTIELPENANVIFPSGLNVIDGKVNLARKTGMILQNH
jgi:glycosidase